MTEIEKIKQNLGAISDMRTYVAEQEQIVRTAKDNLAALRIETLELLKAADLKSMKSSTIAVSIAVKRDVKIINPEPVKAWLRSTYGPQADQYLSVDAVRTKPLLKTAMWTDGEQVEGVERTETETLTVKDIKAEESDHAE